jgi:hypothetical protein
MLHGVMQYRGYKPLLQVLEREQGSGFWFD